MAITPYHIRIAPHAAVQIRALTLKNRKLIFKLIETLAINPRPPGVVKIAGMTGLYSESLERFRLIYKVDELEVLILAVKA